MNEKKFRFKYSHLIFLRENLKAPKILAAVKSSISKGRVLAKKGLPTEIYSLQLCAPEYDELLMELSDLLVQRGLSADGEDVNETGEMIETIIDTLQHPQVN